MFDVKTINIDEIFIPERIRPVDEDHAQVIAASIAANGLINPITVRATPNAKKGKYTLVAGAHRLRACVLNGSETIDAIVVNADQTTATLLEISENLFRNELSVIDRAAFVQTLRDLYEQENGKITRGGDQKSKRKVCTLIDDETVRGFTDHVTNRLGISKRSYAYLNVISQNLNPTLRESLRHSAAADNQALLLKLAKLPQVEQQRASIAMQETNGDLSHALKLVGEKNPKNEYDADFYLAKAIEFVSKLTPAKLVEFDKFFADFKQQSEAA